MIQLLSAIRLACPSLPIGAYAYSQGLEYAVEAGWIGDRASAECWIVGLLDHTLAHFDLPLLSRLYQGWKRQDFEAVRLYERWVLAGRESREFQAEERHLGAALLRLLIDLEVVPDHPSWQDSERGYLSAFALAGTHFGLSERTLLGSYCFAWLEHQVSAVTRLVPLGQTDGQMVLSNCLARVEAVIETGLALPDDSIGALAPGQALASALHETQYTRLFRS